MTSSSQQNVSKTENCDNEENPVDLQKTNVDENQSDLEAENEDAEIDNGFDSKVTMKKTEMTVGPTAFEHLRGTSLKKHIQNESDSRKAKRLKRLKSQLSYDYKDEPALWSKSL